ncbi:hypothetical protein T11_11231 [Trichinella zimbabwensis]|uniref:Uncharacterized protein n=1 Tax=Trichinella zimbabwensis TaxID=268475 RepID=A0A0V1H6U9_9BILA|nr:hypothetical protein T11_11231 [Trichinella zimbabwensis]
MGYQLDTVPSAARALPLHNKAMRHLLSHMAQCNVRCLTQWLKMHELVQAEKILSSDTSCEFTSCMKSRKWHSRLCNSPRQTVRLPLFHIRLKKRRNRGLHLLTTLPLHLHYSRKRLHLIVKIWITVENGGAIAGDSWRYTANKRQCGREANADSEDSRDYPEIQADLLATADSSLHYV